MLYQDFYYKRQKMYIIDVGRDHEIFMLPWGVCYIRTRYIEGQPYAFAQHQYIRGQVSKVPKRWVAGEVLGCCCMLAPGFLSQWPHCSWLAPRFCKVDYFQCGWSEAPQTKTIQLTVKTSANSQRLIFGVDNYCMGRSVSQSDALFWRIVKFKAV